MVFKAKYAFHYACRPYSSSKPASKNKLYTSTVLLPQTKFPLRLENEKLIERDLRINNLPEVKELYSWQRKNLTGSEFILHDGPPYANGAPHMGHAINKILKDTILRWKVLQGNKVHYIPGWDCHGLPIELKAVTAAKTALKPTEIRHKAKNFAKQTIEKQKNVFQSWGVMGDWPNSYTTYNNNYIKNQMQQFYNLWNRKLVFRDVKPVYWSPSSRTALAEAELEYNSQHKSTSAIIKLPIKSFPVLNNYTNVHALIWTTTPWSLPSNQAVCFNPELTYSLIQTPGEAADTYIVATKLVENLAKKLQHEFEVVHTFSGALLHNTKYSHPLNPDVIVPFLPADYASDTKGTGLVHTAPAHGPDDFLTALRHKLPIACLVDENGCYTSEVGPKLAGLFVLSEGTEGVLQLISDKVLHKEEYVHSYPYDWRTKKPIIIRASQQWFVDTDAIKEQAIECLENVQIMPNTNSNVYRHNLVSQLKKRPYWCISRQRSWGVPIPVFYNRTTGSPVINSQIIDNLCNLLDKHGPDYWWTLSVNELLPKLVLDSLQLTTEDVQKGEDILDIWFDSGLSWSSVLQNEQIADLYLEGVDQFTGWFQSSLITSVALREKAPYKAIYVHGFAVDSKGLKMSKSLGNVIDPQDITKGGKGKKAYGTDALRWWVVCHANKDATANVSANVLQASADEVQKIRSVLRFSLGALHDWHPQDVDYNSLLIIDKYLLHLLWNFNKQATGIFVSYQFNKLAALVIHFLTNPVSALYYMAIKDRLYCNGVDDSSRIAVQYVLMQMYNVVTRFIAPVVPHLAEELYMFLPQNKGGSFFQYSEVNVPNNWCNNDVEKIMNDIILNVKKELHQVAGPSTTDLRLDLNVSPKIFEDFQNIGKNGTSFSAELSEIFQVSEVNIKDNDTLAGSGYSINVVKTNSFVCNRCRRYASHKEDELCNRCELVIRIFNNKDVLVNK